MWFPRRGLPGISPTPYSRHGQSAGGINNKFQCRHHGRQARTGKVLFNYSDLSQATEMYFDEMMLSGVDPFRHYQPVYWWHVFHVKFECYLSAYI